MLTLALEVREVSIKLNADTAKLSKEFIRSISNQGLEYKIFSLSPINQEKISLEKIFKDQRISIKKLRRSRVIHLLNSGKNLDEVNENLGLKLGKTYERFEIQNKDYVLLKEFKNFHPRA